MISNLNSNRIMTGIIASPDVTVIRLHGSCNAANAIEFQQKMKIAVNQERHTNILVDLEQVESLDSAGLMALVYGQRLAQVLERRFSLCSVPAPIQIIFELTQLDQVFEIFESIAAFETASPQGKGACGII